MSKSQTLPETVEYLRTDQAAEFLQCSREYLESMRCRGIGPRFYKPSRKIVLYSKSDLIAFVQSHPAGGVK